MSDLKKLEQKYEELGAEIEQLKKKKTVRFKDLDIGAHFLIDEGCTQHRVKTGPKSNVVHWLGTSDNYLQYEYNINPTLSVVRCDDYGVVR